MIEKLDTPTSLAAELREVAKELAESDLIAERKMRLHDKAESIRMRYEALTWERTTPES